MRGSLCLPEVISSPSPDKAWVPPASEKVSHLFILRRKWELVLGVWSKQQAWRPAGERWSYHTPRDPGPGTGGGDVDQLKPP